jgi:hypothetical protein
MSELMCSSEGCTKPAVETLFLRDQPGHVHDCAEHAHDVREWCDVIASEPIVGGRYCLAKVCTGNDYIGIWQPTPLEDA